MRKLLIILLVFMASCSFARLRITQECYTDSECHALDHANGITDHTGTYWWHPKEGR